jgi:hypothetical protein
LACRTFDCAVGIIAVLLVGFASDACAQSGSSGDDARAARAARETAAATGADVWDANHDGIYTCDEWKAYLGRMFNLADRYHDGRLDQAEFPTIRKSAPALAEADFGYFDENQDGKLTREEFVNKPNEFILSHDKNGDCRVTPDELKESGSDQKAPGSRGKKF